MTDATNTAAPAIAPEATPRAAATKPASTTTIALDGKEIELRGISVEQGQQIYAALPAEYKQRADAYAAIAKNYERALKIEMPEGMSFSQGWKEYSDAVKKGVDFAHEGVAPHLKKLDAWVKEHDIPVFSSMRRADGVLEATGDALNAARGGASDAWNMLDNVGKFLGVVGNEAKGATKNALGLGISDAQAKAFGTVFAAAEFHESAVRQGLPLISNPFGKHGDSLVFNYKGEALGAAGEHVTTSVPILSTVWTLIVAAAKFVKSFFSDDDAKDITLGQRWEKSLAAARAEHDAKHPELSYEERLVARIKAGETERAADKVTKAETVADIKTAGLVAASTGKTPYVAKDGTTNLVATNAAGTPTGAPLVDADGKPVGRIDRVANAAGDVAPNTANAVKQGNVAAIGAAGVGVVAAGAAMYQTGRGAAEGVVSTVVGRDAKIATEAANKAAALEAQAQRIVDGKPGFFERWSNPETIKNKATAIREAAAPNAQAARNIAQNVDAMASSTSRTARVVGGFIESSNEAATNLLRKLGRGIGSLGGRMVNMADDFGTGASKAIHALVNGADEAAKTAGAMQGMGKVAGTVGVAGIALAPLSTAAMAAQDIGEGKTGSALLHSTETAGLATMMLKGGVKMGLKRVPYVAPIVSTVEGVNAGAHGDKGGMVKAGTELGTIGAGAAIGAGIGVWFGGIGAAPGAAIGATIGGIASFFTGSKAEKMYNESHPKAPTQTPAGSLGTADAGISAAAIAATEKAEQARLAAVVAAAGTDVERARMAANRTPFARTQVQLGSTVTGMPTPTANLPQGNLAQASLPPMA